MSDKWRTQEPLDDPQALPLEQPSTLKRAVSMVLSAERKRAEDISTELALAPNTIETLCNLEPGTLATAEPASVEPILR